MKKYQSGAASIAVEERELAPGGTHPAMLLLHGSMGAGSYWLGRFAPAFAAVGADAYAPRYFQKTRSLFATQKTIFDGKHFPAWLEAVRDGVGFVGERPNVDARRIGVLGFSLGAYLAMALAAEDQRIRAVVALSGGMPPGWEEKVTSAMPPVLLLHGAIDPVVPVSEAHKAERILKERGVRCELEIYPGERHWMAGASHARALARCTEFLRKNL